MKLNSRKILCAYKIPFSQAKNLFKIAIVFGAFLGFGTPCFAQPSGGPHGPVQKTYEIPQINGTIYYVSPDGKEEVSGKEPNQPTTLKSAVKKGVTGDAIILRGGVYRTGELVFNQGLTFQPYKNEQPLLKGTFVANNWEKAGENLWKTKWNYLFPADPEDWWRREREEKFTPLHRFNDDMVFVDGSFLQSASNTAELDETTFFVDYENKEIYMAIDPSDKLIEITAFSGAIHRVFHDVNGKTNDGIGPVIRGIDFTQYADSTIFVECKDPTRKMEEAEMGKEVQGTLIENCDISYCSRIATFLMGDKTTVRNCKISNTSREGIYVVGSADVLLEKNIIATNNIENITGCYPAGVKIFNQCYRCICRDNLVTDMPNSNGIWYDVGNVDGRFINNWIENVGGGEVAERTIWPSYQGFFFEISKGAIVAGNVFKNCDRGILALNSSNVEVYQNTFVNSTVCFARDTRSAQGDHFGFHPSTGPDVDERYGHVLMNNLLTGDENFKRPLLLVWQPAVLCEKLNESPFKYLDNNVFVQHSKNKYKPLAFWSPVANEKCQDVISSISELQSLSTMADNCQLLVERNLPLFKSPILGSYQLLENFPGLNGAGILPEQVQKIIGIPKNNVKYIGAYPY